MKHRLIPYVTIMLASVSVAAFAQPTETITVTAPYIVTTKQAPLSLHQNALDISIAGTANYSDLDLGNPDDIIKLRSRINDTARSLCRQLEQKYPVTVYVPVTNQDCVKSAAEQTTQTVSLLVSAHQRK